MCHTASGRDCMGDASILEEMHATLGTVRWRSVKTCVQARANQRLSEWRPARGKLAGSRHRAMTAEGKVICEGVLVAGAFVGQNQRGRDTSKYLEGEFHGRGPCPCRQLCL